MLQCRCRFVLVCVSVLLLVSSAQGSTARLNLRMDFETKIIQTDTLAHYFANITVGNKTFPALIDIGSSLLMIPSPHCTVQAQGGKTGEACAPPGDTYTGTQFLPCADTPTHCNCQPVPAIGHDKYCVVRSNYPDGHTLHAAAVKDEVTFENNKIVATFGTVYNETAAFQTQAEKEKVYSILGLGFSNAATAPIPSLFDEFVAQNKFNDSFSICLGPSVGNLVIGGIDPTFQGNETYTVPTAPNTYDIKINNFAINNTMLNITGTWTARMSTLEPNILFPATLWKQFKNTFQSKERCSKFPYLCNEDDTQTIFGGNCFSLSRDIIKQYPVISFETVLENGETHRITIGPEFYFRMTKNRWNIKCVSLGVKTYMEEETNVITLGQTFFKQFYILFDRNNSRIQLSEAENCGNWTVGNTESDDGRMDLIVLGSIFGFMGFTLVIYFIWLFLFSERKDGYEVVNYSEAN